MAFEAADRAKRIGSRRLTGIAIGLWLAIPVVLWNTVFDRNIRSAEQRYLQLQALHGVERGPSVTVRQVMDPAIHDATVAATLWAVVPAVAGLMSTLIVARRARMRPADRRVRLRAGGR